jgi:hypothetical protein
MEEAGGKPIIDATPGITLYIRGRNAVWANSSADLNYPKMKPSQLKAMQAALEKALPGTRVTQYEYLNEAIQQLRSE